MDAQSDADPPTWKLLVVKWIGLFPTLLLVSYAVQWAPVDPPLWAKLLGETIVLIPLLNYVVTPAMDRLFAGWLNPDGGS